MVPRLAAVHIVKMPAILPESLKAHLGSSASSFSWHAAICCFSGAIRRPPPQDARGEPVYLNDFYPALTACQLSCQLKASLIPARLSSIKYSDRIRELRTKAIRAKQMSFKRYLVVSMVRKKRIRHVTISPVNFPRYADLPRGHWRR